MSSHNSLAGVGLICSVVDVGSLNDFLDGVNLVGSWDWDSTWDGNLIRLSNMGDLDDLTGNGTWDGNGVSRSRSSWDGGRGDGSIRCWGSRDGRGSNRSGLNNVLRSSGNIRMGRLGDGLLSSNSVSMSSNNLLYSGLNGPVSDNS